MSRKKTKQERLFKNEKYKKDLVYLYLIYAYLDIGLREEEWVISNKFGVNVINELKLKNHSEKTQLDIKKLYATTKRIFKYLMQEGVFNNKKIKGDLIIRLAETEINKAFSGYKDCSIIPIYLGILMLISWQEDVKYKSFNISLDYKYLADITLAIEEEHKELKETLNRSSDVVYHFYKNIYGNYPWFKESGNIDLKELFKKE